MSIAEAYIFSRGSKLTGRLKQTGLVLSASSKSWLVKKEAKSGKAATGTRRRKRSGKQAEPTGVWGLETPQLVGIGAAATLAAVFVGLVASTFK